MRKAPRHQRFPSPQLSDESAAEILDFLQVFIAEFEKRYGNQIRRYHDERSQQNIIQADLFVDLCDVPG